MRPKIFERHIFPSILWFILLFLISRITDQILHSSGLAWVGRYLGIPGTFLILLSFLYSLRKKKTITIGKLKSFLKFHEWMAWLGSLMVLVHGGIHFHAYFPWIATGLMVIVIGSGFTGAYLQKNAQAKISESRDKMISEGMDEQKIEEILYRDSLTVDYMKKWRSLHLMISSFFTTLVLFHIISVLWYMAI